MLGRHVPHVELLQPPEAAGQADHARRIVGVDVHLDQLGLPHHQHRVAERGDLRPDAVDVQPLARDQELGAVAPALFGQLQRRLRGSRLRPQAFPALLGGIGLFAGG